MKYIIALSLIFIASISYAQDAFCIDKNKMQEALAKAQQVLVSNAMIVLKNKEPALLGTYVNIKTRKFTMIISTSDGNSCIILGGGDYTEYYVPSDQPVDF